MSNHRNAFKSSASTGNERCAVSYRTCPQTWAQDTPLHTLRGEFDLSFRNINNLVQTQSSRLVVYDLAWVIATTPSWTDRQADTHPDGGTTVHHYASIKRLFTVELIWQSSEINGSWSHNHTHPRLTTVGLAITGDNTGYDAHKLWWPNFPKRIAIYFQLTHQQQQAIWC